MEERLAGQLAFVLEVDAAKRVLRRNPIADGSRRENDAEHSWHLALMAMVLAEHTSPGIDLHRVIRMLLIHDVVEIDAGDTFVYDEAAHHGKIDRERAAADRIFGLLPDDQRADMCSLWEEFEAGETREARFANAIDRLHPLLLNYATEGGAWREHGITADRVLARNAHIGHASPALWEHAQRLIAEAIENGYLESGVTPAP